MSQHFLEQQEPASEYLNDLNKYFLKGSAKLWYQNIESKLTNYQSHADKIAAFWKLFTERYFNPHILYILKYYLLNNKIEDPQSHYDHYVTLQANYNAIWALISSLDDSYKKFGIPTYISFNELKIKTLKHYNNEKIRKLVLEQQPKNMEMLMKIVIKHYHEKIELASLNRDDQEIAITTLKRIRNRTFIQAPSKVQPTGIIEKHNLNQLLDDGKAPKGNYTKGKYSKDSYSSRGRRNRNSSRRRSRSLNDTNTYRDRKNTKKRDNTRKKNVQ